MAILVVRIVAFCRACPPKPTTARAIHFGPAPLPACMRLVCVLQLYPNSTTPYSLTLHTTHDEAEVHLHLTRRMLGWGAYNGEDRVLRGALKLVLP